MGISRKLAPPAVADVTGAAGLALVPRRRERHSALAMWHLLSLDAPTVAAVWTVFLARCAGVALPWVEPCAMFVAVWMLYAADRLLDARPLADNRPPPGLEARHHFHHRHRRGFLAMVAPTAVALALLLHRIDARALHLYSLLAALLGAWLLMIHGRALPAGGAHRLPKEIAVGLFFPAAVLIPTVAREPGLRLGLVAALGLFSGVCTLNCLFVYLWEHPQARGDAHWTTRWATAHLVPLAAAGVVIAAGVAGLAGLHLVGGEQFLRAGLPAVACALSIAMLLVLHGWRRRVSAIHLRAAADLVLLWPLLWR